MSSSASLADYRAALTAPGAAVPVLASAVGRLPIAMLPLATLLYVQRVSGSFAAAGLVSAGTMIGVAAGSVAQGRVMDRLGPSRPLLLVVALFVVAVTALVAAVETGQPLPVLVTLATVSGLVRPALEGASRSLWTTLAPPGPARSAALTYEAISLEIFFILGPAIAAFLVAAPWPGLGVVVASAAMAVGAGGFALSRPARRTAAVPARDGASLLGALARPGMRTVALAALGFGLVVGSVEVGVPAVTAAAGSPTLGGVLLSAWSITSVLAGVLYGMRPWPRPLHLRMPVLLAGFAVLVAAMALVGPTGSLPVLMVTMLTAGALITPQVTGHSLAVDIAAPPDTATEAFGWVITAATLGIATGQSSAGFVVEAFGPSAAFLSGALAGVAVAAAMWLRRATLMPRQVEQPAAVA
jgi:MFS family permease